MAAGGGEGAVALERRVDVGVIRPVRAGELKPARSADLRALVVLSCSSHGVLPSFGSAARRGPRRASRARLRSACRRGWLRRLGGQQRERHHGACRGDAGGDVVGRVEAVEEGRASGVVDGRREQRMAGVGQPARDRERGADGCVGGPRDARPADRPAERAVSRLAYSDA